MASLNFVKKAFYKPRNFFLFYVKFLIQRIFTWVEGCFKLHSVGVPCFLELQCFSTFLFTIKMKSCYQD